jgi:hypothetical protein
VFVTTKKKQKQKIYILKQLIGIMEKTQNPKQPRIGDMKYRFLHPWALEEKIFVYDIQGNETAFAYPSFEPEGYDGYFDTTKKVLEYGLRLPTGPQTALLLHAAYCSDLKDREEFKDIRKKVGGFLWVCNRNLWTPKGVYVTPDIKGFGSYHDKELEVDFLEEKLRGGNEIQGVRFSQDGKTSFAPKETYRHNDSRVKEQRHTVEELANDGFIIASFGVEGAERLGEVAATLGSEKNYIFGVNIKEGEKPDRSILFVTDNSKGPDHPHLSIVAAGADMGAYIFAIVNSRETN